MVSRQMATENPEAVAGLTRALNRALIEVAQDMDAGMEVLAAVEPLIDTDIEKLRFDFALRTHFVTNETAANGMGAIDTARMAAAIDILVDIYDLPRTPAVEEIFDATFLPPLDARQLSLD
jgi:NitT/TauT family transport system substrate-binding protein